MCVLILQYLTIWAFKRIFSSRIIDLVVQQKRDKPEIGDDWICFCKQQHANLVLLSFLFSQVVCLVWLPFLQEVQNYKYCPVPNHQFFWLLQEHHYYYKLCDGDFFLETMYLLIGGTVRLKSKISSKWKEMHSYHSCMPTRNCVQSAENLDFVTFAEAD